MLMYAPPSQRTAKKGGEKHRRMRVIVGVGVIVGFVGGAVVDDGVGSRYCSCFCCY